MNYYILFVQTQNQDVFVSLLEREGLKAYSPKFEYYRRDMDGLALKALFPGYVIVKSQWDQITFMEKIRKMEVKKGLIKELRYEGVSALTKEETTVLERLLDQQGILKMSYGHFENKKLVIDSGPLVGFEDYVTKVDRHNHLLQLDLFFLENQRWIAGITIQE